MRPLRSCLLVWHLTLGLCACLAKEAPRGSPVDLSVSTGYRIPLERDHPGRFVDLDPLTRLYVFDISPEKPRALVFVHGDVGTVQYWKPQIDAFKSRYRIIAYEREDCGRSAAPPSSISYSSSARNLLRLLSLLRVKTYVLIGHSRGQEIAAVAYSLGPPGLRGFIAEGTAVSAQPSPGAQAAAREQCDRHSRGAVDLRADALHGLMSKAKLYSRPMGLDDAGAAELIRQSCAAWRPSVGLIGGVDVDIRAGLATNATPMLQIDGAAYRVEIDRRQAMQRFYRNASLVLLPGIGHVPHLEAPGRFNEKVDEFLRGIGF